MSEGKQEPAARGTGGEHLLELSAKDLREIISSTYDLLIVARPEGGVIAYSPGWELCLGWTPEELRHRSLTEQIHPDDVPAARAALDALRREGTLCRLENRYLHRDGTYRWVRWNAVRLAGQDRICAFGRDITAQKEAEEALKQHERRLSLAVAASGVAIWEEDLVTASIYHSPQWYKMLGYQDGELETSLRTWESLCHPDDVELVRDAVRNVLAESEGKGFEVAHRMRAKDGNWHWISTRGNVVESDASGKPLRLAGTNVDITERKQAEERLQQMQRQVRQSAKMDALGRLAGGVAHDFNNLLTIIAGYTELALAELHADHPLHSQLIEVNKAAARASQLTRQLLAFSRQDAATPELVDVGAVVSETEKMLRRLIGQDIGIETHIAPALPQVMADSGQIAQVLMNLVVNARDAMPNGGKIGIATSLVEFEGDGACALGLSPGNFVRLQVSDTGTGMDEETLGRIFEPFFTTKPAGKGTGLGLAIVYGVVKQCGGAVRVKSRPGAGTRFDVFLPVARTGSTADRELSSEEAPSGSGTVLLVEDEEAVRRFAAQVLSGAGYQVLMASNGAEALDVFQAHAPEIRFLLTDLTMPELGGRELARRLLGAKPSLAIIYMSGHSSDTPFEPPGECDEFIRKPFRPVALLKTLQCAIERKQRGAHDK